ncbi:hypothetical protein CF326_g9129 [Tilletia indica]|nr:hypothetical protein CF326_g9129 [Tilletia indica]
MKELADQVAALQEAARLRREQGAAGADGAGGGRDRAMEVTERSRHMSFLHDPTIAERAIHPWPNSSVRIPKDIVNLARHGTQIPLIWLTVEGMRAASKRGRKLITFPTTPKVQEQLAAAHEKDLYLPRGAFSQALQALVVLWTAVGPQPAAGEASQASLLEDLHLVILAQAVDEHWPIWRAYAKRALDWVFEERKPGEGIGLDICKIDKTLLEEAEQDCGHDPGHTSNFTRSSETMVAKLLKAEGDEVEVIGIEIDRLHQQATFGMAPVKGATAAVEGAITSSSALMTDPRADRAPQWATSAAQQWPGPSGHSRQAGSNWQRRDDRGQQPFQRAPSFHPSRDGGAWPQRGPRPDRDYYTQRTPQFCTTCLEIVNDHDFRACRRPHNKSLEQHQGGWRLPGKDLPFCNRFNTGGDCQPGCSYGHYCSSCGGNKCFASKHLRATPISGNK